MPITNNIAVNIEDIALIFLFIIVFICSPPVKEIV
jgi:hypothetical protein